MKQTLFVAAVLFSMVSAATSADGQSAQVPLGVSPATIAAPGFSPVNQAHSSQQDQQPESPGLKPPETDKLRIAVRFLAAYGSDKSQESLGLENQGRVGYAIVGLSGHLGGRFSYLFEVNPVHETQPLPSCGEPRYFYPNTPQAFGPNVVCDNNGRLRVDDYRFIALDAVNQQGPIRQAYLEYAGPISVRFGRFILPIGFGVEEAGSFTAKDATHIQRIDAEANFGVMISARRSRGGRPLVEGHVAAFLGDGNRFHDYDYYYSLDASLDTNSALTALASGTVFPFDGVEVRAAYKFGYTGSKVEVLPNFYASKRNDRAVVLSAQYSRALGALSLRAFGEYASYMWGPTDTSADMLGLPRGGVRKDGYYAGGDVAYQVTPRVRVGVNATREELSRDDSLIMLLAAQGLYQVSLGKKERSLVWRFYADINRMVTVGLYRNSLDNPFPWVSGIVPIQGDNAYGAWGRGNNKWGLVVRFTLR
jgi:hypothetical protein